MMTMRWGDGLTLSSGTCEALVKVFDADKSGKIEFYEFAALHQFVNSMQTSFYTFDRDRSGNLDYNEISQALGNAGFQLNQWTVDAVLKKFGRQSMQGAKVDMDGYLQVCAFLGQIKATFERQDTGRTGSLRMNLEQLVALMASF